MTTSSTRNKRLALRLNLALLWLTRRWLRVAITVLAIYVILPFAAPTMMHLGLTGPGRFLYTLYSPFCHQFAFRSIFLYGPQPVYPRAISGTNYTPFEVYAAQSSEYRQSYIYYYARSHNGQSPASVSEDDLKEFTPWLQFAARDFVGTDAMGYKMTLCARDISIYSALLAGAVLFARVRRRLRPVPLLLYAFLGLGPIALDGLSQLLGYPPFNLWPPRETSPLFRIVTGAIFGLMNAWLGLPYIELSMRETRESLEEKLRQAGINV